MSSIYLSGYDIEFYKSVVEAREREAQDWKRVTDAIEHYIREHVKVFDSGSEFDLLESLSATLGDVLATVRAEKVDRARSLMQELPTEAVT